MNEGSPEINKRELTEAEKALINKMNDKATVIISDLKIAEDIVKISESAKYDMSQNLEFRTEEVFSVENINFLINSLQDILESSWEEFLPESNSVVIKQSCEHFGDFISDVRNKFIEYLSLYFKNFVSDRFELKHEEFEYLKTCVLRIEDVIIPELEKLNYGAGIKILEGAVLQLELKLASDSKQ